MENGEQGQKLNFPEDDTEVLQKVTKRWKEFIFAGTFSRLRKKKPPRSLSE